MKNDDRNAWYREWFNTPWYHLLYEHRDEREAAAFIRRIIAFLQLREGARVLDLACGKGRHARQLHALGFDVTGIDLSEMSIREANGFSCRGLQFIVHDMREPVANLSFDAVFNLFTSFGYFENEKDNQAVIGAVAAELIHGGYFVIDFLNAEMVKKSIAANNEGTSDMDGCSIHWRKKIEGGHVIRNIEVRTEGKTFRFMEKVRLFTEQDFRSMLSEHFDIVGIFGNYLLEPFVTNRSDRFILVARRK